MSEATPFRHPLAVGRPLRGRAGLWVTVALAVLVTAVVVPRDVVDGLRATVAQLGGANDPGATASQRVDNPAATSRSGESTSAVWLVGEQHVEAALRLTRIFGDLTGDISDATCDAKEAAPGTRSWRCSGTLRATGAQRSYRGFALADVAELPDEPNAFRVVMYTEAEVVADQPPRDLASFDLRNLGFEQSAEVRTEVARAVSDLYRGRTKASRAGPNTEAGYVAQWMSYPSVLEECRRLMPSTTHEYSANPDTLEYIRTVDNDPEGNLGVRDGGSADEYVVDVLTAGPDGQRWHTERVYTYTPFTDGPGVEEHYALFSGSC